MRQFNFPPKKIAMGQVWVSIALILLSVFFAFTPLISIDLNSNELRQAVNAGLDSFGESIGELKEMKIPEQVNVTSLKLIKATSILIKMIQVSANEFMSNGTTQSDADLKKQEQRKEALLREIESEEGREAIVMSIALFGQVFDFTDDTKDSDSDTADTTDFETQNSSESFGVTILFTVVKGAALFVMLLFILVIPFYLILYALISLIRALTHREEPEKISGKVCRTLIDSMLLIVPMMLMMTVFPGIGWGYGLTALFVLTIVNILVNFCATRLRSYSASEFKYVNLAQGIAAVEMVGFAVYFSNLLHAGVLREFIGSIGTYVQKLLYETEQINDTIFSYNKINPYQHINSFVPSVPYLVDVILILAFVTLSLGISTLIANTISSCLGFTANRRSRHLGVTNGVIALITCILPMVASKLNNAKSYSLTEIKNGSALIHEETKGAIYTMPDSTSSALIGMLIGALIILAAGIAFIVLKKKFCSELTHERQIAILQGRAASTLETAEASAADGTDPAEKAEQEDRNFKEE